MSWSAYGWIVTTDHNFDADPDHSARIGVTSRVGEIGPYNVAPDIEEALEAGKGRAWRTLFDQDYDGQPQAELRVYEGRYIDAEELGAVGVSELYGDEEFGPLEDLSKPDCGAVSIQYRTSTNAWQSI